MSGFSPIDQLWCRIQFRQANYDGVYMPPSADVHWIEYPGYNGGSGWGSLAVDPECGVIIVNYNDIPNHNRLIPREQAEEGNLRPIYEQPTAGESGKSADGEGDPPGRSSRQAG